jgi:hypothetical protein
MPTLKTGCLAFVDTLCNGLVPCKIIRIDMDKRQDGKPVAFIVAQITAQRGPYRRGERISSESPGHIVPRDAVKRFRGQVFPRILPFDVVRDEVAA